MRAIVMSNQNSVICSIARWRARNCEPVEGLGLRMTLFAVLNWNPSMPPLLDRRSPLLPLASELSQLPKRPLSPRTPADALRHTGKGRPGRRAPASLQSANLRMRAHYIRDRAYVIAGGVGSVVRFGDRLSLHLVKD